MITLGIQLTNKNLIRKTKKTNYRKKNCYPINNLWLSYTEDEKEAGKQRRKKENNFINKIANN